MSILCEHNNETEDGWTVRKSEGEKCKRPSLHDEHLERSIWAKESILVKSWEQAHMSKRIVKKKKKKLLEEFCGENGDLQRMWEINNAPLADQHFGMTIEKKDRISELHPCLFSATDVNR